MEGLFFYSQLPLSTHDDNTLRVNFFVSHHLEEIGSFRQLRDIDLTRVLTNMSLHMIGQHYFSKEVHETDLYITFHPGIKANIENGVSRVWPVVELFEVILFRYTAR